MQVSTDAAGHTDSPALRPRPFWAFLAIKRWMAGCAVGPTDESVPTFVSKRRPSDTALNSPSRSVSASTSGRSSCVLEEGESGLEGKASKMDWYPRCPVESIILRTVTTSLHPTLYCLRSGPSRAVPLILDGWMPALAPAPAQGHRPGHARPH